MKKIILLATLFTYAFSTKIFSQTGTISGKIVDNRTGEALTGVSIRIENTNLGTKSSIDGNFTISKVPVGEHTIEASILSYKKMTEKLSVKENAVTEISFTMESSSVLTNEVKIKSKRKQESLSALAVIQKNSTVVADGISRDVITRTPDRSSADVVKRVSGSSMQDGKFAIVRGLADRYNNAMLNSTYLSSTEADRKSFSFDLIPSSIIDNLMVIKTASPDLSGDFAGGIIQVMTKAIPDENYTSVSASLNFNTLSTFRKFNQQSNDQGEFLGLGNGGRSIVSDFPTYNGYNKLSESDQFNITKKFSNTFQVNEIASALPGGSLGITNAWNKKYKKFEIGSIVSLNYSNSYRTLDSVYRASYNAAIEQEYLSNEQQYRHNMNLGGIWSIGLTTPTNHKFNLMNIFNNNAESLVINRNALDLTGDILVKQSIQQYVKNTLRSHQFSGESILNSKNWKIKYQMGISSLNKNTPDLRRTYYIRENNPLNPGDTNYQAFVSSGTDPRSGGRFFSELTENSKNIGADLSIPFTFLKQKHTFKSGIYGLFKDRSFYTTVLGYIVNSQSSFNYNLITQDVSKLYSEENIGKNGFILKEIYSPEDSYKANSDLNAGYLMLDDKLGKKLRVIWGARIERFNQELMTPSTQIDSTTNTPIYKVNSSNTYVDILPSANFIYSINDKSNLRLSVSKTVSRPEFRELSRFTFYDYTNNSTTGGNPELKSTNIYNADLRFEIFQKFGQMFTVSTFYKLFEKPIEQTVDFTGPETRVKSFVNAQSAINLGAETEFRMKVGTLIGKPEHTVLSNLLLTANVAYIYSRVKFADNLSAGQSRPRALQGQSPIVVNTSLLYTDPKTNWSASIFYNVVGDRISEVGSDANAKPNVNEKHRHIFDIQIGKKLSSRADFKFTINDILAQPLAYYIDYPNGTRVDFITQRMGTTFNLGFNYKF